LLASVFLSGPLGGTEKPPDGVAITRLLFFIAPSPRTHLELLARLSSALRDAEMRRLVMEAAPDEALMAAMRRLDAAVPSAKGGQG